MTPYDLECRSFHLAARVVFIWSVGRCIGPKGISLHPDGTCEIDAESPIPDPISCVNAPAPRTFWVDRLRLAIAEAIVGPLAERRFRRMHGDRRMNRWFDCGDPDISHVIEVIDSCEVAQCEWRRRLVPEFSGSNSPIREVNIDLIEDWVRLYEQPAIVRLLKRARVWRAVESVACSLIANQFLSSDMAFQLIEAEHPFRPRFDEYERVGDASR
jgi:hypothetical protein